jgi:hypothetical protein
MPKRSASRRLCRYRVQPSQLQKRPGMRWEPGLSAHLAFDRSRGQFSKDLPAIVSVQPFMGSGPHPHRSGGALRSDTFGTNAFGP